MLAKLFSVAGNKFSSTDFILPERHHTLLSGIFYRKSVCLSSVTFVRPTQPVEISGNVSTPFYILAIR